MEYKRLKYIKIKTKINDPLDIWQKRDIFIVVTNFDRLRLQPWLGQVIYR